MENWYLVRTKVRRERQVAVQLHQRGYLVYLPLVWVSPVKPRDSREQPYFPGHLFAKLDLQHIGANVIRWSPGVRGLVEFCGEPASIPDMFIDDLQRCLNRLRSLGGMENAGARFADCLQANKSLLRGYEGMLNIKLSGADRVRILLACVYQEFGCQNLPARPVTGLIT